MWEKKKSKEALASQNVYDFLRTPTSIQNIKSSPCTGEKKKNLSGATGNKFASQAVGEPMSRTSERSVTR